MSLNGEVGFQPLSRSAKIKLTVMYLSYMITILYPIVMFKSAADYLDSVHHEQSFYWFSRVTLTILTGSDMVVNLFAVDPTNTESLALVPVKKYNDLVTKYPSSCLKYSLGLTVAVSYFAFAFGSLTTLLGFKALGFSKNLSISLGLIFSAFGLVFYNLLFGEKLIEHHFELYGNVFPLRCCRPVDVFPKLEALLQIISNALYRGLTFSFFMAGILTLFGSDKPIENVGLLFFTYFASVYSSVFSRSLKTWQSFQAESQPISEKLSQASFWFFLFLNLTRIIGVSCLLKEYMVVNTIVTGSLIAMMVFNLSYLKFSPLSEKGSPGVFFSALNFFARVLRILVVSSFSVSLCEFLSENNVECSIDNTQAFMIALALTGIEANNFTFYQDVLSGQLSKITEKLGIEEKVKLPALSFRFFTRSLGQYKEAFPGAVSGHTTLLRAV